VLVRKHSDTMTAGLPERYSWRRAKPGDAEAIFALVTRYNATVIGRGDWTLDDARDELAEPDYVLETDSWLVHAPDTALTGYAWAIGKGTGEHVDIEVVTADDRVSPWLFNQVLARAAERARAGGHDRATVDMGIYRDDRRMRATAEAHGFTPATAFYRMRVDHGPVVPTPVAPDGIALTTGPGDEKFRRMAHAVLTDSFKEHFGWVARPFVDWQHRLDLESVFDWWQLAVAQLAGRPVAVLITNDRFVEDENCGYVADLGVLPDVRGRGIATFLLMTAFAADIRAGRTGTILHVDSNNRTPALAVYEGVGMRPVLVIDMWQRTVLP
jgi:GNAT superfamily N-acetyltransferase